VPRIEQTMAMPRAARPLPRPGVPRDGQPGGRVVYFPSCLSRIIGSQPGETGSSTAEAVMGSLAWAGYDVVYPDDLGGLCCGMPFASKAFSEGAELATTRTMDALFWATREGKDPVVTDASPCAGTLDDARALFAARGRSLRLFDFAAFWAREVLPRYASVPRTSGLAMLHPTCTLMKHGGTADLLAVARAHAAEASVPASAECCGFAGDRGFLVPELTASAAAKEGAEIRARLDGAVGRSGAFSTCRTCEIGMSRAVGRPVRSVAHLVHEALTGA
jgi:D-lactate dehydrogenase